MGNLSKNEKLLKLQAENNELKAKLEKYEPESDDDTDTGSENTEGSEPESSAAGNGSEGGVDDSGAGSSTPEDTEGNAGDGEGSESAAESEGSEATDEIPADILTGNISQVTEAIEDIDDVDVLKGLLDAEIENENRKGAVAAIDKRIAAVAE